MDPVRFDSLSKTLSEADTRRGLVRLLVALPLGITLSTLLSATVMHRGSAGRRHDRPLAHDFPVRVLAPDAAVVELPEVAAPHHDTFTGGGGAGQQPLRDTPIATDPVPVFRIVDVG